MTSCQDDCTTRERDTSTDDLLVLSVVCVSPKPQRGKKSFRTNRFVTENGMWWFHDKCQDHQVQVQPPLFPVQETSLQRGVRSYIRRNQHRSRCLELPGRQSIYNDSLHGMDSPGALPPKSRMPTHLILTASFKRSHLLQIIIFCIHAQLPGENLITRPSRLHWNGLLETNSHTGQHAGGNLLSPVHLNTGSESRP